MTLTGANLNGATAVSFGGTAATFTINSPTSITAIAPASASGTINVTVTTPGGTSSTGSGNQFQFVSASAPTLSGISPAFGPMAGGTTVTLTGAGFTGATQVLFDGVAATGVTVVSDTQITATAPAHAAGDADVSVLTPAGTSVPRSVAFTYSAIGPTISSLGTTSGPTSGGTLVTINGVNLTGATAVYFNNTPASLFYFVSDSQIQAVSPLAAAGAVGVTVVTPSGTSSASTFTYTTTSTTTPTITSLSTTTGPSSGGTVLTITGTNLAGTMQVLFGDTAVPFTLVSSTSLSVTAPVGVVGTVHVTVTTPLGISSTGSSDQFTYQSAPPTITGLSASSDTTAGGTLLTITGTNYSTATRVSFGSAVVYDFSIVSNTTITVFVPIHAAGAANVTVTNTDGTSSASSFNYTSTSSTPTVTGLSPTSGPTGGGTSVTLTGTNFTNVLDVLFDGTAAGSIVVNSATSITATAPAHTSGAINVTVATTDGISSTGSGNLYTYNATAPTVTGLSPSSGPTGGGTTIVLTGANLNGAITVKFNGVNAPSFTVDSATQITAVSPAGSAGTPYVTVTTPYGTSATGSANQFTYVAVPTVTALSSSTGSTAGGATLNITGSNFTGLVSVSFNGMAAASIAVNSSTSLTVTTPANSPGTADVVVTTGAGSSATSVADEYTFAEPIPSVIGMSLSSSVLAGGSSITIGGSNFTGATALYFGSVRVPSFTVVSSTTITATVPAATTPGMVDVRVAGAYGTLSNAVAADQFNYYGTPAITSLSPGSDTASGGVPITIAGTNMTGATAVAFGGSSASFTVVNDTTIIAIAPGHATGAVNVTVTSPGGTSAAASFTYNASQTVTWTGPATGNWGTAANWSTGSVPGSGADVVIPMGVTVTHSTGTDSIHQLTVVGSLIVSGGTLSVAATAGASSLTVSGGTSASIPCANFVPPSDACCRAVLTPTWPSTTSNATSPSRPDATSCRCCSKTVPARSKSCCNCSAIASHSAINSSPIPTSSTCSADRCGREKAKKRFLLTFPRPPFPGQASGRGAPGGAARSPVPGSASVP